ncbi:MAG: hypothetical protein H6907_02230 [Hyphomicrobiales bacterium]|nr:hypothetical protein [Hyphomicrobiales bacterium]MCP5370524.1 hypothetical protein [Hyphomicrobiales bacterium]
MPVLLATSRSLPPEGRYDHWCALPGARRTPGPDKELPDLAAVLEEALAAIGPAWLTLGKRLSAEPSAVLAHTPSCAGNLSDLGLMLAWTRIAQERARAPETLLLVCDDPWMFRHLARLLPVAVGKPPPLWPREWSLAARGVLARLSYALRAAAARVKLMHQRALTTPGQAALLVYGHPASTADGQDGYFGTLMAEMPGIQRVLHVDCPPGRARDLAADGRTASLHAWGGLGDAWRLPLARWRPAEARQPNPLHWLIRRAAALEGGTGTAAAVAWQRACQARWLAAARPRVVAWPWENHGWERALVRAARAAGTRTVGYQHATVGRTEWNYAPGSNPDGAASLPDRVLCAGAVWRDTLLALDHAPDRIAVGGAWRMSSAVSVAHDPAHDPAGPVFVALPFDLGVAAEMVAALSDPALAGRRFLVRPHPMTPAPVPEAANIDLAERPLAAQDGIAAVLYAATSVGLEAILAGLPTLRFRPRRSVPMDILPAGVEVPTVDAAGLAAALADPAPPPALDPAAVFAPVDRDTWSAALGAGGG